MFQETRGALVSLVRMEMWSRMGGLVENNESRAWNSTLKHRGVKGLDLHLEQGPLQGKDSVNHHCAVLVSPVRRLAYLHVCT